MINNFKRFILLLGDILILFISLYIALLVRYLEPVNQEIWNIHWPIFAILFILWLPIYYAFNFYDLKRSRNLITLVGNTIKVAIMITVVAIFYFYIAQNYITITPKTILAIIIIVTSIIQFSWRRLFTKLIQIQALEKNIIFLGYDPLITSVIYEAKASGYKAKAIFDENYSNNYQAAIPVITDLSKLPEIIKEKNIEQIVIANSLNSKSTKLLFNNLNLRVNFITLTHFYEILFQKIPLSNINQSWFLENLSEGDKSAYENQKRLFDIFIALLLGIITLLFIPLISLLIAITSKGNIFFKQIRTGKDNKTFKAIKFRTMYQNAESNGPQWATKNDPRITTLGKFLRKTRIDEIPQLWNILIGEMSFVGPRPERPEFINELVKQIPFYKERLLVKPGLTGWAQVLGPSYGGSEKETLEKLQYDLYYIKNRSFFLDLGTILKTINTVLKGSGQ
ncbi:sugar transferase [bacterium]|nr:sugar transferase [bacterium]